MLGVDISNSTTYSNTTASTTTTIIKQGTIHALISPVVYILFTFLKLAAKAIEILLGLGICAVAMQFRGS